MIACLRKTVKNASETGCGSACKRFGSWEHFERDKKMIREKHEIHEEPFVNFVYLVDRFVFPAR